MFSLGERRRSGHASIGPVLRAGAIAVLASLSLARGLRAETPPQALRLPADAVYDSTVGADSAVVFRHGTHVALAGNRCTGCHPKLFKILAPTRGLTHAEMNAGRACGSCHDGEHAFGVRVPESCPACHVGSRTALSSSTSALKDGQRTHAFSGPRPIHFKASDVSPGPVTFDHATHAKGECAQCHPRLFPMKSSAVTAHEGMHEPTACGACHDGKRGFSVEDAGSCARCHREGAR